jgi:hypothetical protein
VARRIMDELLVMARALAGGRRGRGELHDDMLFALLSHQVLAVRRSMLDFAAEILTGLTDEERSAIAETVELLVSNFRNRRDSGRYGGYQPVLPDYVRQLAVYSANLVCLRLILAGIPVAGRQSAAVPLADLFRRSEDPLAQWRSTALLWNSSLDADSLQAVLQAMERTPGAAEIVPVMGGDGLAGVGGAPMSAIALARLTRDVGMERVLRFGTAALHRHSYYINGDSWADSMLSWLLPAIAGHDAQHIVVEPPEGTTDDDIRAVTYVIFRYLEIAGTTQRSDIRLIELLFSLPKVFDFDMRALAVAAMRNPNLHNILIERDIDINDKLY